MNYWISQKNNLIVIEDAAQALLSIYKEKYLGTIGHLACLSFHETKNIISGEGGALLINDPELEERAEIIWEKGTNRNQFFKGEVDKYTWVDIGSSFLPSEILAAFLYAQLEEAEKINATRSHLFDKSLQLLRPLEINGFIRLPYMGRDCFCNGHIFYIITRSLQERTALINYLKNKEIGAVFHYVPLHSSPAGLKYGRISGSMDITNDISNRVLRLPMYYEMKEEDVERGAEEVSRFYRQKQV
jgi:dTDP-4-amino-4,6-dideoxygalactose transaminase